MEAGVQAIRWRQLVNGVRDRFARGLTSPADRPGSGNPGGNPVGAPLNSGDARGIGPYSGGRGFERGAKAGVGVPAPQWSEPGQVLPHERAAPKIPDVHVGSFTNDQESADVLYFGGDADLTPDYRRFQVGRHSRAAIESLASVKARGSSSQRSGPEGTLVIYPPRLPRLMATDRAISPNTVGRRGQVQRVGTPQINVVQAAGDFG